MIQFPSAFEFDHRFYLESLLEDMSKRQLAFIDVTLMNHEIEAYLASKGYTLVDIRYDYKDQHSGESGEFGFFGRTSGDGHRLKRIIWGNVMHLSKEHGDHRI